MKRKLIIVFALCFAFNTVAFAENLELETLAEELVIEETIEDAAESEEVIEPEFSLVVETVTDIIEETEEIPTEIEMEESTTIENEIEIQEEVTEYESVAEIEDSVDSIPIEKVSEAMTEVVSENEDAETNTDEITDVEASEIPTEEEPTDYETGIVTEATAEDIIIEVLSAEVDEIIIADQISDNIKQVLVDISGNNLEGRCASIAIKPINDYGQFLYMRSYILENVLDNEIVVMLPEEITGIYQVDVNVESLMRESKVIVTGECDDTQLKCEANRKTAIITGKSSTTGIKEVMVKILDVNGKIAFLKQTSTDADGSYTVNATLPVEGTSYVVWVTIEGESGGYVKKMTPFLPTESIAYYTYTCKSDVDAYEDVLIYAKNLSDAGKYTYELDYSAYMNDVHLVDIYGLTRAKEIEAGLSENGDIEIIGASDGKIRFVTNFQVESGKLWSGLLNIVRFKRLTSNEVTFTLRIYE